jgi:putative solute:sodium symporter small subunit
MKTHSTLDMAQARAAYWRRVVRLTQGLIATWLLTTFCTIFFARELSRVVVFGWPLSFYLTAQGLVVIYVLIIGFYAWGMRRLDKSIKDGQRNEQ